MSIPTVDIKALAGQLESNAAKLSKDFLSDSGNRADVAIIGDDAAKAVLRQSVIQEDDIPELNASSSIDERLIVEGVLAQRSADTAVVAEAMKVHQDAVKRLQANAIALGEKVATSAGVVVLAAVTKGLSAGI